jgi:hypothetical protein
MMPFFGLRFHVFEKQKMNTMMTVHGCYRHRMDGNSLSLSRIFIDPISSQLSIHFFVFLSLLTCSSNGSAWSVNDDEFAISANNYVIKRNKFRAWKFD